MLKFTVKGEGKQPAREVVWSLRVGCGGELQIIAENTDGVHAPLITINSYSGAAHANTGWKDSLLSLGLRCNEEDSSLAFE